MLKVLSEGKNTARLLRLTVVSCLLLMAGTFAYYCLFAYSRSGEYYVEDKKYHETSSFYPHAFFEVYALAAIAFAAFGAFSIQLFSTRKLPKANKTTNLTIITNFLLLSLAVYAGFNAIDFAIEGVMVDRIAIDLLLLFAVWLLAILSLIAQLTLLIYKILLPKLKTKIILISKRIQSFKK